MEKYDVWALTLSFGTLTAVWETLQNSSDTANDVDLNTLDAALKHALGAARRIDADPSLLAQIDILRAACAGHPTAGPLGADIPLRPAVLASQIGSIVVGIQNNLQSRLFMYVRSDQATYYNNPNVLGVAVRNAFPGPSLEEIILAGNCYAAGLWTASVFHSMRFAEHGLRRLAKKVNVSLTDKGKPLPIEYATWDKVIRGGLRPKLKAEEQRPKGPSRERRLEWYSSLADHCEYMKDIWRNTVAHSRRLYNQPEALAAIDRVRDFSQKLVAGVPR